MNPKPFDNEVREVVRAGMSAVPAPPFDLAAVRTKAASVDGHRPAPGPRFLRPALILAPLAAVAVVFIAAMPSVIAQVERVFQAFTIVNGQTVPMSVHNVSLAGAQAAMPFRVVVPAGIPAGLKLSINTLTPKGSTVGAHVIFQYTDAANAPMLTIDESADRAGAPQQLLMTDRESSGDVLRGTSRPDVEGPPLPKPGAAGGPGIEIQTVERKAANGRVTHDTVTFHPDMWVENGTRIVLGALPGGLSQAQVAAIRAAMSR